MAHVTYLRMLLNVEKLSSQLNLTKQVMIRLAYVSHLILCENREINLLVTRN